MLASRDGKRTRKRHVNTASDHGGRKTGIELPDKGLRDEHGLEPISGIFSSPAKSPPKRGASSRTGDTVTESESMDIQESMYSECACGVCGDRRGARSDMNCRLHSRISHFCPPPAQQPNTLPTPKSALANEDDTWFFATATVVYGTPRAIRKPSIEPNSRCITPCGQSSP